jgi:hypothetical protein
MYNAYFGIEEVQYIIKLVYIIKYKWNPSSIDLYIILSEGKHCNHFLDLIKGKCLYNIITV